MTSLAARKTDHVPLSSPDVTEEDIQCVVDVLRQPTLSLGPRLTEFEDAARQFTKSRYAIAVNSGTSGLHLGIKAAGIGQGDEVITTPFSFIASANVILFEGGVPVFVDIDPATYNLDVSLLPDAVSPRTRAILPVHVFGQPCEIQEVMQIAHRFGLCVIEDACEAIGARAAGRQVGTFGQTGVFAFYPNKQMTTGEGGVIVTDDEHVAAMCRSWRNQGRGTNGAWLQHERLGYNYRLSDINCALGSSQLRRLPEMLQARAQVASHYSERLKFLPDVITPPPPRPGLETSWFVYVVRLQDEFRSEDRDYILEHLRARGIGCQNYFAPIHLQPYFREAFGFRKGQFPVTEHVSERTIALPFFNRLSEEQIEQVCLALREAIHSRRSSSMFLSQASQESANGQKQPRLSTY